VDTKNTLKEALVQFRVALAIDVAIVIDGRDGYRGSGPQ